SGCGGGRKAGCFRSDSRSAACWHSLPGPLRTPRYRGGCSIRHWPANCVHRGCAHGCVPDRGRRFYRSCVDHPAASG
nr:hypothetical protein [Tanacetum cinerariifolium]